MSASRSRASGQLFRLAQDKRPVSGTPRPTPDALVVPPLVGPTMFGTTLEEVMLLRDELADMAWAVERKVESAIGQGSSFSFDARFRKPAGVCETEAQARASLRGKRVLIVDADGAAAQWICRQISSWGLECEIARTRSEALEALVRSHAASNRFDFAAIDLDSGAMNGVELGRAITAVAKLRTIRLIAIHKFGHRPDYPALRAARFRPAEALRKV